MGADEKRGIQCSNRSLFADKFPEFPSDVNDKTARSRTIQRLAGGAIFEKNETGVSARLKAISSGPSTCFEAALGSRLIINHAGGVIENAGLAFDRNLGVPYLPGSSIKGIARVGAAIAGAEPGEIASVFGWSDQAEGILPLKSFAGSVAFLPAFPRGEAHVERDIVNCHHPAYYSSQGKNMRALDNESPIPNEFPVVKAGSIFIFTIRPSGALRLKQVLSTLGLSPGFDPVVKAKEWLIKGITDHGIGAKTAAGYGWFVFDAEAEKTRHEQAELVRRKEEDEKARITAENERLARSEERRVGKECRSRWSPYH